MRARRVSGFGVLALILALPGLPPDDPLPADEKKNENEQKGVPLEGVERARELPGVHTRLYGKVEAWPGRKMGHLTVTGDDAGGALRVAREARRRIRIAAESAA